MVKKNITEKSAASRETTLSLQGKYFNNTMEEKKTKKKFK